MPRFIQFELCECPGYGPEVFAMSEDGSVYVYTHQTGWTEYASAPAETENREAPHA